MSFPRFIVILLGTLVIALMVVSAFCRWIDPYDIFGAPRTAGLNQLKARASSYAHLTKPYQIERAHPKTVMIGSSRVDIGFDPTLAQWPAAARPVYNFGFPNTSILNMQSQLVQALAAGSVHTAVVALEFQDFLRNRIDSPREPDEIERRFMALAREKHDLGRIRQTAVDGLSGTVTLSALMDSIGTVAQQRQFGAGDVTDDGLTSELPYVALVSSDGYHELFAQKDINLLQARQHATRQLAKLKPDEFLELTYLRNLIDFCRARQIELKLVIPPYHVDYLEIIHLSGLWDRFESWKRVLTELVQGYHEKPGSVVVLWDFASYDEYTTEVVPGRGDRSATMKWFWEPVHFKKALGDIILSRMLGGDSRDFGVELTPASLEARLTDGRRQRELFRQKYPAEVQRIDALMHSGK